MENNPLSEPLGEMPTGTVTFLFTDIEASTSLLQELGQEYRSLLKDHHRIMREEFTRWHGHEIDTQGDQFFASFARASEALNCVIELQRRIAVHNWPNGVTVSVRMGLHTGEPWEAEEGYVGIDVHRAARIAHTGHGGQVLLSETTAALVMDELPDGVEMIDVGRHRLKDLRRPERIHQLVIGGLPTEFPPLKSLEALPDERYKSETPLLMEDLEDWGGEKQIGQPIFVARQAELARLVAMLEKALAGSSSLAFIIGGPGRGKTALLTEFTKQALEAYPELLVVKGNCHAYSGAGDPYLPFRQVLAMLVGVFEPLRATEAVTLEGARRLWATTPLALGALGRRGENLLDVLIPAQEVLQRATQAGLAGSPLTARISELAGQEDTFAGAKGPLEAYTQLLYDVASKRPVLLLLDDLQWADSASINLLFHLGRELVSAPVFIVCAYRPEEIALGRAGGRHPLEKPLAELKRQYGEVWIDLAQADEEGGRTFIDQYLDSEPNKLSESFRQVLYQQTGGQALFTVELLRNLQERGDLLQDVDDTWIESPDLDWRVMPARVEGVIEERIGRLEDELYDILTVASVEGQDFTAQVLARVQGVNERGLVRQLSGELSKVHRLVGEGGALQVLGQRLYRYRFLHHLFQKYLYNNIGEIERSMLHQDVGLALEALYGEEADQVAAQLAWHFEAAGETEKAIDYLLSTGDRARLLYAQTEAIDFYKRAIALLKESGDDERAARTWMKLGLTYQTAFQFREAQQAYDESDAILRAQSRTRLATASTSGTQTWRELRGNIRTLDNTIADDVRSAELIVNLFEGLVELEQDMAVLPGVAKSWQISPDGRNYVFQLRENLRWSDGHPLTTGDFEYAFKRYLAPKMKSPKAVYLFDIAGAKSFHQGQSGWESVGVSALDDSILEVTLAEPTGYFLYVLSGCYPLPQHVVEKYGEAWTEATNIVSNGPYRLATWLKGEKMVWERNERYHGCYTGNIQKAVILIREPETPFSEMFELYENDEVDMIRIGPPEQFERLRQEHAGEYLQYGLRATRSIAFLPDRPPFNDPRVRRAFVFATDRVRMNEIVRGGRDTPATGGFVPPGLPGHVKDIAEPYDPERARSLLAEAGYPGGRNFPTVKARIFPAPVNLRSYEYLSMQWQENLGIMVGLDKVAWADLRESLELDPHHLYISGWYSDYPDPDDFLRVALAFFRKHWRNNEYERLIELARLSMDQDARIDLYAQAERLLVAEALIMPLLYFQEHLIVKPWVKNIYGGGHSLNKLKNITIEPH